MRAFCVLLALTICGVFICNSSDSWAKAVQANQDLSGILVVVMLLPILAAPFVALVPHFGGGASERVTARDADDDVACG